MQVFFKAVLLVFLKRKILDSVLDFLSCGCLWLEFMYFVVYISATAGCWSSKENFSQNSFVAKRKWHSWTLAGTKLLSYVQFWNLKTPLLGEASHTASWAGLLLQEESGVNNAQSSWDLWEVVHSVSGRLHSPGPLRWGPYHRTAQELRKRQCRKPVTLQSIFLWPEFGSALADLEGSLTDFQKWLCFTH